MATSSACDAAIAEYLPIPPGTLALRLSPLPLIFLVLPLTPVILIPPDDFSPATPGTIAPGKFCPTIAISALFNDSLNSVIVSAARSRACFNLDDAGNVSRMLFSSASSS